MDIDGTLRELGPVLSGPLVQAVLAVLVGLPGLLVLRQNRLYQRPGDYRAEFA